MPYKNEYCEKSNFIYLINDKLKSRGTNETEKYHYFIDEEANNILNWQISFTDGHLGCFPIFLHVSL